MPHISQLQPSDPAFALLTAAAEETIDFVREHLPEVTPIQIDRLFRRWAQEAFDRAML